MVASTRSAGEGLGALCVASVVGAVRSGCAVGGCGLCALGAAVCGEAAWAAAWARAWRPHSRQGWDSSAGFGLQASVHRSWSGAVEWNPWHGLSCTQTHAPAGFVRVAAVHASASTFRWQQWKKQISRAGETLWLSRGGHGNARLQIGRPSGSRHAWRQATSFPWMEHVMTYVGSRLGWVLKVSDSSCDGFLWRGGRVSVFGIPRNWLRVHKVGRGGRPMRKDRS